MKHLCMIVKNLKDLNQKPISQVNVTSESKATDIIQESSAQLLILKRFADLSSVFLDVVTIISSSDSSPICTFTSILLPAISH